MAVPRGRRRRHWGHLLGKARWNVSVNHLIAKGKEREDSTHVSDQPFSVIVEKATEKSKPNSSSESGLLHLRVSHDYRR